MKAKEAAFGLLLLMIAPACAPAAFISTSTPDSQDSNGSGDAAGAPIPVDTGSSDPARVEKKILEVTTPSTEIKAGKLRMLARARIKNGDPNPKVTWTVKGPNGLDSGTIDDLGVYFSPEKSKDPFEIEITATLVEDSTVSGSTKVTVIPFEEIFARCLRGNEIFPIVADVYAIPVDSQKLPNFDELSKVTTVCMDQYAVSKRRFENGFPDVPNLFEWFALKTNTILIVPEDGRYTFRLNSDDGSKLFIDNRLVIDNDGQHSASSKDATIQLTKGEHVVNLDYFQGPRVFIALELFWQKPGANDFEIVPRESFK